MAVAELAALGYWVDSFVVDARWFVPQSRPRLFLVGFHDRLKAPLLVRRSADADVLADSWRRAILRAGPLRPSRLLAAMETIDPATGWATIGYDPPRQANTALADFLDVDDHQPWWDAAEVARHRDMMFDRHRRRIEALQHAGDEPTILTGFRRIRQGRQRLEVRFDGVAGCLRTPRGGSAKQVVLVVRRSELRMRWMTPREYARLQGAPDYALPDNAIQGYFGFGDAVCVPVIEWIDRRVLTPIWEGVRGRESEAKKLAMAGRAASL
jgi:DNA (cytosine-5)-methyltransferase 1